MYTVRPNGIRLYDFDDDVQLALTYQLSGDLQIVKRKVYGILDFLGDLGGLASSIKAFFFVAISIFQYKAAVSYVASHTFLIRDGDEIDKKVEDAGVIQVRSAKAKQWKQLTIGFFSSIRLSLQRLFNPVFCGCCKRF